MFQRIVDSIDSDNVDYNDMGNDSPTKGELYKIVASILMRTLHAVRATKFDVLSTILHN